METVIGVVVMLASLYFVYWLISRLFKKKSTPQIAVTVSVSDGEDEEGAKWQAERKRMLEEIKALIGPHIDAVRLLQAMGRIDGQTSEAERRLIFAFLVRNGAPLQEEKHWAAFSHWITANEAWVPIKLEDISRHVAAVSGARPDYKRDVGATAQAIVAVGGTPKKKEQAALDIVTQALG